MPSMRTASGRPTPDRGAGRIPRDVRALGIVSLCMDTSSEMIHSLLPVFLVSVLGASTEIVGIIEGVARSDRVDLEVVLRLAERPAGQAQGADGRRLRARGAVETVFRGRRDAAWVLGARFVDRVGKGIRGAPRDALIGRSDTARASRRGLRAAAGARHGRRRSRARSSRSS